MAFQYANPIGEGTDAELLVYARSALARSIMSGKFVTVNGTQIMWSTVGELQTLIGWLESRIDADSNAPTETLVRFKR